MAAASVFPLSPEGSPRIVSLPLQKKIFQDALECIVQMKAEFFQNHQPITDDSIMLQRFCAKFEHLLQVGMKEKTSLLGRKKDYWDYFCECLGSAKGSNDGIKYVKSLGENKTSLGRGRAFIRFSLVHQRLADTLQQCVVHDKTQDWFVPSSVLVNQRDCQTIINSLYDLNSMHFDLSPRGYDLDTAWPSFANHKAGGSGAWNIPISRRSSITSMDTVSQISMSVDPTEMDRLTKDLEMAQTTKSELIDQIDALQQEKEQVSQSAWATQGEMQALQQQLAHLQSQHATLQEKFKDLDISYMKVKLEKEHLEKLHRDEIKVLNEKFEEEQSKRVSQLQTEEEIWKKEVKEESERGKREIDRLQKELQTKATEFEEERLKMVKQQQALTILLTAIDIKGQSEGFEESLTYVAEHVHKLERKVQEILSEKVSMQAMLQGMQSENNLELSRLEGGLTELDLTLKESQESQACLLSKVTALELDLKSERETLESLKQQNTSLAENERKLDRLIEEKRELENTRSELEVQVQDLMKERNDLQALVACAEASQSQMKSESLEKEREARKELQVKGYKIIELSQIVQDKQEQITLHEKEIVGLKHMIKEKNEAVQILAQSSQGQASELEAALKQKVEMLVSVQTELEKTKGELAFVRQRAEEIGNGNLILMEQLSSSESENATIKCQYQEVEEKEVALEQEVEKMRLEAQRQSTCLEQAQVECHGLKNELASLNEELTAARSLTDNSNAQLRVSEAEKEELKTEIIALQAEREDWKQKVDSEHKRLVELLEGVRRSNAEKSENISSLIVQLEELQKGTDIHDKDQEGVLLNAEIEKLQQEPSVQADAMKQDNNRQQNSNDSEWRMKAIIAHMESDAEEMKIRHENETASFSERIGSLELKVEESEKKLKQKCLDYEAQITSLASLSAETAEQVNKLNADLAALTAERDHLLVHTDAALEDARQIKSQLTETSEQLALTYSQVEIVTAEKHSLSSEIMSMTEVLTKLDKEKSDLKREIEEMKLLVERSEDESQQKLCEKREVELELEEMKMELSKVMCEKSELELQLDGYQSQTEFSTNILEEALVETRDALENVTSEKAELEDKYFILEKDRDTLKTKFVKLEEVHINLQRQMTALKETPFPETSEVMQLREELEEERRKNSSAVEMLNEEISALQFQLSSEHMQKCDILQTENSQEESVSELKARISDLEIIIEQLEEELNTVHKVKETDSSQIQTHAQRVQELKKQLKVKHETCDSLENQLQELESRLMEELSRKEKLEGELTLLRHSYSRDIEVKDAEVMGLRSDNEQIKKKLVKLLRDKDMLWHKTDQLVTEQKKKAGDRWQDNVTVTHCLQCKIEFSLFVRKHHCRLCGKIYCWSCSDYWLDSPHSSKKVRVCRPCFDYHNDLGAAALSSTSMIDNESDDEGDDDDDDQVEQLSTSSRSSSKAGIVTSTNNQTDEKKIRQRANLDLPASPAGEGSEVSGAGSGERHQEEEENPEAMFQIVDQDSVLKSIQAYNQPKVLASVPSNMTSSMVLIAEELESGEVNKHNEVWIKPGKTFAVPIDIEKEQTVLHWQFTSQPKDIVFSVNYRSDDLVALNEAEEICAPCKCDSHRQTVQGELLAKKAGIYTLLFDNTYSRMTSKKIHYSLDYKKHL